jgi:conjugal transfer/type IV secretion protein DotA/TraY
MMLTNKPYKIIFALLALVVPSLSLGVGIEWFSSGQDVSLRLLGLDWAASGSVYKAQHGIVGLILGMTNWVITILGVIVLIYTIMTSAVNTAQEGQILGKKISSFWTPLRTMFGVALLAPTPGGYSLAQFIVIAIVVNSVHGANQIWYKVSDMYKSELGAHGRVQILFQTDEVGYSKTAKNLLTSMICTELYNNNPVYKNQLPPDSTVEAFYSDAHLHFGIKNATAESYKNICGRFTPGALGIDNSLVKQDTWIPANLYALSSAMNMLSVSAFEATTKEPFEWGEQDAILRAHKLIMALIAVAPRDDASGRTATAIYNDIRARAGPRYVEVPYTFEQLNLLATPEELDVVSDPNIDLNTKAFYYNNIKARAGPNLVEAPYSNNELKNSFATDDEKNALIFTEISDRAKVDGWIMAGSYFYTLVNRIPTAVTYPPPTFVAPEYFTSTSSPAWREAINKTNVYAAVTDTPGAAAFIPPAVNAPGTGNAYGNLMQGKLKNKIGELVFSLADRLTNRVVDPTTGLPMNPMVSMRLMGSEIIFATEIVWIILMIVALGIGTLNCFMSAELGFCWGFTAMASILGGIIAIMLTFLYAAGVILALYVPMIPYIVWTFSVITWFILVGEAIVAAPILALGFSADTGHGVMGKLTHGSLLLMGLFLRPALMIIGLLVATKLSYTAVMMVNFAFFPVLTSFPSNYMVFGWIAVMMLYGALIISVLHVTFTPIHVLPDKIMRWLGGRLEQSNIQRHLDQARGQVEAGAKMGESFMKAGAAKAMKSIAKASKGKGKGGATGKAGALGLGGKGGKAPGGGGDMPGGDIGGGDEGGDSPMGGGVPGMPGGKKGKKKGK